NDLPLLAVATEVAAEENWDLRRAVTQYYIGGFGKARVTPRRARVVERDDKISYRRRFDPRSDRLPWRHQIGQRDRAEIVAERRARAGGGSLQRGDPRTNDELYPVPVRPCRAVEKLEDERAQTVDPGIPRGNERHRPSCRGEVEREAHPCLFLADRARMQPFAPDRAPEQIEIKAVADDVRRLRQRRARLGGAPGRIARTDPNYGELS